MSTYKHITNGVVNPLIRKFITGGPVEEGGYSSETKGKREWAYDMFDPSGGFGPSAVIGRNQNGGAKGEENEYWKAYLGFKNAVPKMNPKAKTSWDDKVEAEKVANGELPSDFYGTTPRMDLNIQAIADTLHTGQILRNYDKYKQEHPDLPKKWVIEEMYKTGKQVLDNPNEWQQADGDRAAVKQGLELSSNESNPLGMLANFGMMWNPDEGAIYVHDTYDFPKWARTIVGDRPKEMKIRGRVNFDPKKGSKLLRDNMKDFYNYPKPINYD